MGPLLSLLLGRPTVRGRIRKSSRYPNPRPKRRRRCRIDQWRTRTDRNAAGRSSGCAISGADHGLLVDVATLRRSARRCSADAVASSAQAECTQLTRCRCCKFPSLRCIERIRPSLPDAVARQCVRAADRCTATGAAVIRVGARFHSPNNRRLCRCPTPSTVAVFAAPSSVAQHPPQVLNAAQPAALPAAALSQLHTLSVAPFAVDWKKKTLTRSSSFPAER